MARDDALFELAGALPDPEVPVLTLADLGMVREAFVEDGHAVVVLTPTYSGCPATEAIMADVRDALSRGGYPQAEVRITLSPAWSTDWISDDGRRKLREYGIAPPACASGVHASASGSSVSSLASASPRTSAMQPIRWHARGSSGAAGAEVDPECPRCGSPNVEVISRWSSTPCKALYRCLSCAEPFDYFKPY
ncbi:MAG: phenylacetate-CoA oxygenase subunit PaaJ [Burkholderiales bacterium]|nr:phenylacetate-CoA oxygenase subunit PaaJ [Burkholderiales bacterium]